jgi:hypothetical protein
MPNNLSGQFDLSNNSNVLEGTALPGTTDVASFTDGTLTDTASNFTATIDWGDGITTTGTVVGSNGNFTVEGGHNYADEGAFPGVVTITRTTDNSQLVLQGFVSVNDADNVVATGQPTITGNPNQALTNVVVATFTDSFANVPSDFAVPIDWGDGNTTMGTVTLNAGVYTVMGSHTYATGGAFTISTFVDDDFPNASFGFAQTQAVIGFGGTEVFNSSTETFADPAGTTVAIFGDNSGLPASDYTAMIDWGDGTTTVGSVSGSGGTFTVTSATAHTYADEGNFTAVVTVTRTTDNATIAPSGTVAVADTDNLSASGTTLHGDPNAALTNVTVATFTDSNTSNVAGDFVATVDWGDGTTTTGTVSGASGAFTVTGSHTYTQNGQDTIVVTVTEEPDNPQAIAFVNVQSTALIGVAPVSGASINIAEGNAVPGGTQVATFSDSNNTDTPLSFTATIDWGDGTTTAGTVSGALGSFTVTGGPHTYTGAAGDEGQDTVTTTLTRTTDNSTATAFGAVNISESDHLVLTADNVSGSQGTPLNNVQVATFTDTFTSNNASDFAATIDWGDGTTTLGTVSGSGASYSVNGSHTYASAGTDTITVSVADDFPGTANASGTSTATIAARTLMGTMVLASATEATALPNSTTVATFTDTDTSDMAGDFTATINWGDGVTTNGTVVGSNGSFTVEGGHTYADEGSDPAVVTLTHTADMLSATASGSVAVAEADVLAGTGTKIKAKAHQAFTGAVATFSDTDTANVAGDFTASINWGDGTVTGGTVSGGSGSFTVNGTHTYSHPGHENLTVTLNDDAPGTATATAHSTANVSEPKNDFNGDGKSDLLLQKIPLTGGNPNVMVDLLSNNGTTIASSATISTPQGWHVAAAADFTNNGDSDIVLQNDNGTPQIWLMNGTSVTSKVTLANAGEEWHVIAAADFSNDGNPDLLFQNDDTGAMQIWEMNGTSVVTKAVVGNPGSSWHAIGTGDFNGDGTADILFQNNNGTPLIWEMNGTSIVASATLPNPGALWRAVGTGDFAGDGNSDILFQNLDGTPMIWDMNGTSIVSMTTLPNPGITNIAIGTSDFNGDGNADILFQNIDGKPLIWDMNGTSIVSTNTLPNPGILWRLQDDGPIQGGSNQPAAHLSSPDMPSTGLVQSSLDATQPAPLLGSPGATPSNNPAGVWMWSDADGGLSILPGFVPGAVFVATH